MVHGVLQDLLKSGHEVHGLTISASQIGGGAYATGWASAAGSVTGVVLAASSAIVSWCP